MSDAPRPRAGQAQPPTGAEADDTTPDAMRETDYHDDFGAEAGEQGRHPLGRAEEGGDPNGHTMADHDMEGEGYRGRGRRSATGSEEPMTDHQAHQAAAGEAIRPEGRE